MSQISYNFEGGIEIKSFITEAFILPGKVKKVSKMTKMTILVILTYFGTFCEAQLTSKGEKIGFCQNRKNAGNYTQNRSKNSLGRFPMVLEVNFLILGFLLKIQSISNLPPICKFYRFAETA